MILFEIKNNVVTFSPQALLIKPFKEIWDNDKSKDKTVATAELGYIYYFADDRSDFMHILDHDDRAVEIMKFLDLPSGWDYRDKKIIRAVHYYEQLSETTSTKLLKSTRNVLQKISKFLDLVDMDERDARTNKPIHDISKITTAVEKVPKLLKALNETEKEVIKEKEMRAQSGNKTAAPFEDGIF